MHDRPGVFFAGGPDPAAVILNDFPHDGEPDPAAPGGRVPRSIRPVKPVEDVGQIPD